MKVLTNGRDFPLPYGFHWSPLWISLVPPMNFIGPPYEFHWSPLWISLVPPMNFIGPPYEFHWSPL